MRRCIGFLCTVQLLCFAYPSLSLSTHVKNARQGGVLSQSSPACNAIPVLFYCVLACCWKRCCTADSLLEKQCKVNGPLPAVRRTAFWVLDSLAIAGAGAGCTSSQRGEPAVPLGLYLCISRGNCTHHLYPCIGGHVSSSEAMLYGLSSKTFPLPIWKRFRPASLTLPLAGRHVLGHTEHLARLHAGPR